MLKFGKFADASKATDLAVTHAVLANNVEESVIESVLDEKPEVTHISAEELGKRSDRKLAQLVADDFPFDPSQLEAIYGVAANRFACMTGAAGTGKTTSLKKIVDLIKDDLGAVDMSNYWKRLSEDDRTDSYAADADDEYELPESAIPSIVNVSFTGRAVQQIKKNFPREWWPNIMTIHRCLAYMPEYYEDFDAESDSIVNRMRFVPTYDANNKLPWDVVIIDEAGMLGLDLWHNLFAALKPGCRVIMIGDINQLPPVHGRSIFGFAMGKWPTYELTHVHRQKGANNSIVDNAWRILKGIRPTSDTKSQRLALTTQQQFVETINALLNDKVTLDDGSEAPWKFAMVEVPEEARMSSLRIRQLLQVLKDKKPYDPILDSVITATNGHDGSKGELLGQIPLNRELAIAFNKENPRYVIDASRERKYFAVGDKVMATRNDHEAGITNGMTGVVESIEVNAQYSGDVLRWGKIEDVSRYLADLGEQEEDEEDQFTLEELAESHAAQEEGKQAGKEKKDRGPASHIVTVRFGEGEHSFTIAFGSLAEVASLQTAYVVTCHKMQGGESPLVQTICHQAHRQMLYREWAYTAVTRSSERHIFLYTKIGLSAALAKQKIAGKTLSDKIKSFQALQKVGLVGAAVNVKLQDPESMNGDAVYFPQDKDGESEPEVGSLAALLVKHGAAPAVTAEKPVETFAEKAERVIIRETVIDYVHVRQHEPKPEPTREVKDGGDLHPFRKHVTPEQEELKQKRLDAAMKQIAAPLNRLPAPVAFKEAARKYSPEQCYELAEQYRKAYPQTKLLTHQPASEPAPVKVMRFKGLGELLKKGVN